MQWEIIVALIIAIPVILFPAAFVWYMNLGGLVKSLEERQERNAKRIVAELNR
ncbi:MAG TPA: hypothetical protein VJ488_03020 [Dehalococcoidia bacterium]|nr:hypothetical protein [Dehalococcoidia bacterium]